MSLDVDARAIAQAIALAFAAGCGGDDAAPQTPATAGAESVSVAGAAATGTPGGNAGRGAPLAGQAPSGTPAGTGAAGAAGATAAAGAAGMPGAGAAAVGGTGAPTPRAGAGGATAGAAGASGAASGAPCMDTCAYSDGVDWLCKLRYMYGLNYAWHQFGADFGGNSAWDQPGISQTPAVATELADMAANGVNVIRWWLWPDFRGDGVTFDANDNPTGLGGTALADLEAALALAEQHDLYLMLTLFSFDNFRPTRTEGELRIRGITPIVTDDARRRMLMDNVVAPVARAVEASPLAKRVIAWDVINEPEWAITGASQYGDDPAFDPMPELSAVSHAQMEAFARDVIAALRANSKALISVGGTAIKWRHAWSKLDTDFHQFHIYDWVNMYWPYDQTPMSYGLDDKPVVIGEFPLGGLTGVSYTMLVESWFGNQYAGALGWQYSEMNRDLSQVRAFADAHPCETQY
jgi:hypothetical protein